MRFWPEFRQPLFVTAVLVYGLHLLNRHALHLPLPSLVTSYLADALAMPVMLTLALVAQRRLGPHGATFVFPKTWLLAAWLFVSAWFEIVLPHFSPQAVADPVDLAAYALGTVAFHHWLNQPA